MSRKHEEGAVSGASSVSRYMEQMIPIQGTLSEYVNRLNEMKRDARAEGCNVDVLNALVPLLAKYPEGNGAHIVNELMRYAEGYGAKGLSEGNGRGASSLVDDEQNVPITSESLSVGASGEPAGEIKAVIYVNGRMLTQIVASLCVALGLIWLLH